MIAGKPRVLIATPLYGHAPFDLFQEAVRDLASTSQSAECDTFLHFGEPLITRARNRCVDTFLEGEYTHLLFLDGDIFIPNGTRMYHESIRPRLRQDVYWKYDPAEPLPNSIDILLDVDSDITAGVYFTRQVNAHPVFRAESKETSKLRGKSLQQAIEDDIVLRVTHAGTGIMLIRRRVLERLTWPWFNCAVDKDAKEPDRPDRGEYLSEDYYFCKNALDAGFTIHVCMGLQGLHFGTYPYSVLDRLYAVETGGLTPVVGTASASESR